MWLHCVPSPFSYERWKPRNGQLAKMRPFHQSKRSDKKRYAVEVRWVFFFFENLTYYFIPLGGRKYSHTNSYNSAMTFIAQDDHLTVGAWAACGLTGSTIITIASAFAISEERSKLQWGCPMTSQCKSSCLVIQLILSSKVSFWFTKRISLQQRNSRALTERNLRRA